MDETFPFLASRLTLLELHPGELDKDLALWLCLSEFENQAYGVISQYNRIQNGMEDIWSKASTIQVRLDIHYYTLTWDKIKKIFGRLGQYMDTLQKSSTSISDDFKREFRAIRTRIDHLLKDFDQSVRNEYEHPSLEPIKTGHIVEWGYLFRDTGTGDIRVHVGGQLFSLVRKQHIDRLRLLWIELIDVFVKHFTDKRLSFDLLSLKNNVENDIDSIINEYRQYRCDKDDDKANAILHQFTMIDITLAKEGMPLDENIKQKFYSILFANEN